MRILVVTPFFQPAWEFGGIARATTGLSREHARRGHDVLVATIQYGENDHIEEDADGVRIRRFKSPHWLNERLFPWPRDLGRLFGARPLPFDVAHIAGHRNGLAIATARILRRARVPYVFQAHGTFPHHGAWRRTKRLVDLLWGAALIQGAADVIAVSSAEAAELPRRARIIPNGVDLVGTASRSRRALGTEEKELLLVGSDAPQKRAQVMIDILRALPRTRLAFVGRFGESFRRKFSVFGGRVAFRGVLAGDALASAYADADLLVQTARGEAFGLAPFEASLYGTCAVVTGGHGSGEWFGTAGGCVVPPDHALELLGAITARLHDADRARQEAARVASYVRSELQWSSIADRVEAIYRDAVLGTTVVH